MDDAAVSAGNHGKIVRTAAGAAVARNVSPGRLKTGKNVTSRRSARC